MTPTPDPRGLGSSAEIIYQRGHKGGGRQGGGFVIEFRRNAGYEGFQGCEDSIKVKRREIKISYRKFYERDRGVKKKGDIIGAYFSFFSLSLFLPPFY